MNRAKQIARAATEEFDVCIIGGGITGAGLLANATERGWKAVLLEKNDFASGTSSRSSKMIHGGVRYLRYLQINLVREALLERGHILRMFPHLVKRIPFLLPSYKYKTDLLAKDIVLTFYDRLAGKNSSMPKHKKLNAAETLEKLPGFNQKNLVGGIYYWDAWTNDARLTVDVLCSCNEKGAVVLNYFEVQKLNAKNNSVQTATVFDKISNTEIKVKAKIFVNATGVWTDDVLLRLDEATVKRMQPTKGVHVVVPSAKLPKTCVAIVSSVSGEKRFLYTLPWEHDLTILGATDTNYTGTADNVNVSVDDVKYLLETFNAGFPNAHLTMKDVVSVFSGLRPLLKVDGNKTGNYSRSREYEIWWTKNNFVNIAGGKLTSFLSMGKHCLDVVAQKFSLSTSATAATENNYTGKWKDMYGAFGKLVEEIIHEDASNTQVLSEKYNYLKAEIIFFTRYQYAQTVADMLTRRTSITYAMKQFDEKLVSDVAQLMAKELDKNTSWKNEQLKNYRDHWTEYHPSFLN